MSYKVGTLPEFDRLLKKLAKKYPSLKKEYLQLIESLERNPVQGAPLGNNCYKVRIAIGSKGKGKRGGGRVITLVLLAKTAVYLLTIYDKSEQEDISAKDLMRLINSVE